MLGLGDVFRGWNVWAPECWASPGGLLWSVFIKGAQGGGEEEAEAQRCHAVPRVTQQLLGDRDRIGSQVV